MTTLVDHPRLEGHHQDDDLESPPRDITPSSDSAPQNLPRTRSEDIVVPAGYRVESERLSQSPDSEGTAPSKSAQQDEKDVLESKNTSERVRFFVTEDLPSLVSQKIDILRQTNASIEIDLPKLRELLLEFWTHVRFRRVLAAEKAFRQLCEYVKSARGEEAGRIISEIEDSELTRKHHDSEQTYQKSISLIKEEQNYKVVTKKNDIQIWYRPEPGTPIQSIKIDAFSPSNIINYLAILSEIQLLPSIVNGTGLRIEMSMLKEISPWEKIVHFVIHLPWPFQNRETILHFEACDLFEDGRMLILGRSCEFYPGLDLPEMSQSSKPITLTQAIATMEPQPDGGNRILTLMNIDFNLDFVPASVINFVSKTFSYYTFKRISKLASNLSGTAHEKAMLENKQLYDYLKERAFNRKFPTTKE